MNFDQEHHDIETVRRQRLIELLDLLVKQGLSQLQIATRAKIPGQYLSDVKTGRRPMTELIARRLGEEFAVSFEWLLGTNREMESPGPLSARGGSRAGNLWLPLFAHPIEGEPRTNPAWDGLGVEVAGAAAAKLTLACLPYVLRFGHDDRRGRLRKGDLVLVSQANSEDAEMGVIKLGKKLFLARRLANRGWERVATGQKLPPGRPVVGHCLGIIWSSLARAKK